MQFLNSPVRTTVHLRGRLHDEFQPGLKFQLTPWAEILLRLRDKNREYLRDDVTKLVCDTAERLKGAFVSGGFRKMDASKEIKSMKLCKLNVNLRLISKK